MFNPFAPNPFQMVPHGVPPDPTWGTDITAVPLGDLNDLRAYYETATPTFRRNLGVPEPGTPEFERFIRAEYNQSVAEYLEPYRRSGQMPAMPSRNAILPMIPGITGLGALWQQMQQGGGSPFGNEVPPPFGPTGPGRYMPQPDENMGSSY